MKGHEFETDLSQISVEVKKTWIYTSAVLYIGAITTSFQVCVTFNLVSSDLRPNCEVEKIIMIN
jgi:hypothetical protein